MSPTETFNEVPEVPRLLVIDDNPSIHRDFDLVLQDELHNEDLEWEERRLYGGTDPSPIRKPTYAIDHAYSGLEGLNRVSDANVAGSPYRVAFVDIRMPGIDGVETIERLWKIDSRVQVVICTAFADYSWDDLARRLGHTDNLLVLKKPFDSIEVTQLASTLSHKWYLARQAEMRFQQMELLVARRTEKLLALQQQRTSPGEPKIHPSEVSADRDLPLVLVFGRNELWNAVNTALGAECRIVHETVTERAWKQVTESLPEIVVVDGVDNRSEGPAFCARLKKDEFAGHIPTLLVGKDLGSFDPASSAALAERLRDLLITAQSGSMNSRPVAPVNVTVRHDAAFLRRAIDTIEKQLADYEFDVDELARQLALSRRQLFRKLKIVAGTTPNHLIRSLRLQRAAQLLQHSRMNVTEVTYAVGFADLKYFREVFKEHYGVLPGNYGARKEGSDPDRAHDRRTPLDPAH